MHSPFNSRSVLVAAQKKLHDAQRAEARVTNVLRRIEEEIWGSEARPPPHTPRMPRTPRREEKG